MSAKQRLPGKIKFWYARPVYEHANGRLPLIMMRPKPRTRQEICAEVNLWEHSIRLKYMDNVARNNRRWYVNSPSYRDCILRIRFVKAIANKDDVSLVRALKFLENNVSKGSNFWSMYQHYAFLKVIAERFDAVEWYVYFDGKQKEVD